jgi:hypothetical protein
MAKTLVEKTENITLTKKDYQKLLEAWQKLGEILASQKRKKGSPALKTLYGIWKGVKVNEKDFKEAKKSLFKSL